jgi:DNA ligase-1
MIAFAQTCAAVSMSSSKIEKVRLVASYLMQLSDADLDAAARFFSGNPFPQAQERALAAGGRTIVSAASEVWNIDRAALAAAYRATGDLGAALGPFVQPAHDLGLFREELTPQLLYRLLGEIADASGKAAQKRRRILCERIFSSCVDATEATYVVKIMTGELRVGLREGLIVDAIAQAFGADPATVRRAASAAGDLGAVALAAKLGTLEGIAVAYHAPIAFMLASPIAFDSGYDELRKSTWLVEDKYDGIRAQAHVTPGRISIFSRTLNNVAASFPEVVAALGSIPGSCALDGEIVAIREDHVLPFRFLQGRLQRKDVSEALQRETPVRFIAFDILATEDDFLLDVPLAERRARLAERIVPDRSALAIAPWTTLEADAAAGAVRERFEDARARGHEGLVFKRMDTPYSPGRRGKAWLKLKRELATLDCVVVAVERGHGRRAAVLSDYTFAVRNGSELSVLGKAYSGLTDAEIGEMTAWFDAHRPDAAEAERLYRNLALKRREIVVEPQIVVEIAFDIIQRSDLHGSGFSLRFPRIVRLRPDKGPQDANSLADVLAIYTSMIDREGLG